ncbi:unnamed protein product [Lathyrus sativus]|nr:unnamed protein product [Lathyrus sativus]
MPQVVSKSFCWYRMRAPDRDILHEIPNAARIMNQEHSDDHPIHCPRERSRIAWKIIRESLMPYVENEKYTISRRYGLHPDNDKYKDQEQHKSRINTNEWQCGYCEKTFYKEKHIDQHSDNRLSNLLNLA